MSSRVQKGGQKFRPTGKPRGRTAEVSPNVSRKPPSARGATVEPLASHHTETGGTHSPETHALSESAPLPEDFSATEHRDASSAVTYNLSYSKHGGTRRKPVSSSSTAGQPREASMSELQTREDYRQSHGLVGPYQPTNADDETPSRSFPVVSNSRSRRVPPIQHSRSASAPSISLPIPADNLEQPEPTVGSYMQGISAVAVEEPQSHSEETYAVSAENSEWREDEDEEPVTRTVFLTGRQPRASTRRSKAKKKAKGAERVQEEAEVDERSSHAMETRMNRKRRARKEAEEATDPVETLQSSPSPGQTLRRSARLRRKSVIAPEVHDQSDAAETQGSASDSDAQRKRPRVSSASVFSSSPKRRSRNPMLFDHDADTGEELDPTVVTMAQICDDTGQGRLSSKAVVIQRNHLAWKASNREKRERMRATMEAKKYGRKPDEEGARTSAQSEQKTKEKESDSEESPTAESSSATAVEDASGSGFNYKESLPVNRFSAQVRIGPNGETIIDEESLVVDRADNAEDVTEGYQHVEESDQTKFTNSATYSRRVRGSRWSAEETELFYDALQQFGENFELISYVLPGRDRRSCKTKFKVEDNKNPSRINYCLKNRVPFDMHTLSRMTGRDFSGPPPEIRIPELPKPAQTSEGQNQERKAQEIEGKVEADSHTRKQRKRSKTPALTDDVEIVGDIETFDADE